MMDARQKAKITIGNNMFALRKAQNWSQEHVAELSGITSTQYGRIERGQANPRLETLIGICEAFGKTLPELTSAPSEEKQA